MIFPERIYKQITFRKSLKILGSVSIILLLYYCNPLLAVEKQDVLRGNIVIFSTPQISPSLNALTDESVGYLVKILNKNGRLRPVEKNRLQWAFSKVEGEISRADSYSQVAKILNVDLYIIVSLFQRGTTSFAEMQIVPQKKYYRHLRKRIVLKSRIMKNIPLKLGREITHLHQKLPIRAAILNKYDNGLYQLNAGQWNGLRKGERYRIGNRHLTIRELGRYRSIAEIKGRKIEIGDPVIIQLYPKTEGIIKEVNRQIFLNTEYRYSLANTILKHDDPEKRMIAGICIINMGGNICLPGYGAYLSTHYLGFKNASPSTTGIVLSSTLIFFQFTLPVLLTSFKSNFFPWERDSDKTEKMQNLHLFLWGTLPLTFSTAYMDQLSYQFSKKEKLPPFFRDRDTAALSFSLFIPGGGLFYKGHRFAGWCYYLSELALAGYGVYYYNSGKRGIYALSALGVIKLIEIVNAYFIRPSYRFYNLEMEREQQGVSISVNTEQTGENENIYSIGVNYRF